MSLYLMTHQQKNAAVLPTTHADVLAYSQAFPAMNNKPQFYDDSIYLPRPVNKARIECLEDELQESATSKNAQRK